MRISDWSSDVCSSDLVQLHELADRPDAAAVGTDACGVVPRRRHRLGERGAVVVAEGESPFSQYRPRGQARPEARDPETSEIGRGSGRDRECKSVEILVVADALKKTISIIK